MSGGSITSSTSSTTQAQPVETLHSTAAVASNGSSAGETRNSTWHDDIGAPIPVPSAATFASTQYASNTMSSSSEEDQHISRAAPEEAALLVSIRNPQHYSGVLEEEEDRDNVKTPPQRVWEGPQVSNTQDNSRGMEQEDVQVEDDEDLEACSSTSATVPTPKEDFTENGYRAVIYKLKDDGQWDRMSEGYVLLESKYKRTKKKQSSGNKPNADARSKTRLVQKLVARDVEDGQVFFKISAEHEELYHRQDSTVLTVEDPRTKAEYALCFQYEKGCTAIWSAVNSQNKNTDRDYSQEPAHSLSDSLAQGLEEAVQNKGSATSGKASLSGTSFAVEHPSAAEELRKPLGAGNDEDDDRSPSRGSTNTDTASATYETNASSTLSDPAADPKILNQIADTLGEADQFVHLREKALETICREEYQYLDHLSRTMNEIEEKGDSDGLLAMHRIVKGLVLLNDEKLHDALVSDDFFDTVLASFEYDPNSSVAAQVHQQQTRDKSRPSDILNTYPSALDTTDIGRQPSAKEMEVHYPEGITPHQSGECSPSSIRSPHTSNNVSPRRLRHRSDSFSHTRSPGLAGGRAGQLRPRHRHFIRQQVAFRQVVPIEDEKIVELIHRSFRLQFLRDVLVPRPIDDPLHATLTNSITMNQSEVVRYLVNSDEFWTDYFSVMRKPRNSMKKYASQSNSLNKSVDLSRSRHRSWSGTPRPEDSDTETDLPQSPCSHMSGANRIWSRHARPLSPPSPIYPVTSAAWSGKSETMEELPMSRSAGSKDSKQANHCSFDEHEEGGSGDGTRTSSSPPPSRSPKDGMLFLREFMNTARRTFPKDDTTQMIIDQGDPFFDIFEGPLGDPSASTEEIVAALEVLQLVADTHPDIIREFMLKEDAQLGRRTATTPGSESQRKEEKAIDTNAGGNQTSASCGKSEASSSIFRANLRTFDPGEDVRSIADPEAMGEVGIAGGEHGCLIEMYPGRQWFAPWHESQVSLIGSTLEDEESQVDGEASRQTAGSTLLQKVIWRLVDDSDAGIQRQAEELLTYLLEVPLPSVNNVLDSKSSSLRERFFVMFYERYIEWILLPFTHSDVHPPVELHPNHVLEYANLTPEETATSGASESTVKCQETSTPEVHTLLQQLSFLGSESQASKASKQSIVNILSLFVKTSTMNAKYIAMKHKLMRKLSRLLHYPEKYIKVVGVKFVRTCLLQGDEFYDKHVIQSKVINNLMFTFVENGITRYNLVNSAIVELLYYMASRRIKELCNYLLDHFGKLFALVEYADIRKELRKANQSEASAKQKTFGTPERPSKETSEDFDTRENARLRFSAHSKLNAASNKKSGTSTEIEEDTTDIFDFDDDGSEDGDPRDRTVERTESADNAEFIPRVALSENGSDSDDDDDSNDDGIHDVLATFGSSRRKRKSTKPTSQSSTKQQKTGKKGLKFSNRIGSSFKQAGVNDNK
eukprot:gb/GECG01005731.1/.p1 GENE.gb/GECG01005731.1/~~gb/GECG01005731.1/.p1  ORF type:complete len:1445 (+),score=236.70 gb/GECG01005731.1/:1-4335(+)